MEERTCSVDGCARHIKCKGLCGMHYQRLTLTGVVGTVDPVKANAGDKIAWLRSAVGAKDRTACWRWPFAYMRNGYGKVTTPEGTTTTAHRFAAILAGIDIPDGQVARHKCDNRWCLNPEHIEPGTYKQNTRDMYERGRSLRGVHPSTPLTTSDVLEIDKRIKAGEVQRRIAEDYGIDVGVCYSIKSGKCWAWITGNAPDPVIA